MAVGRRRGLGGGEGGRHVRAPARPGSKALLLVCARLTADVHFLHPSCPTISRRAALHCACMHVVWV